MLLVLRAETVGQREIRASSSRRSSVLKPLSLVCVLGSILALEVKSGEAVAGAKGGDAAAGKVHKAGELKGFAQDGGDGKRLFVVPIEGTIDLGLAAFVERVVAAASSLDVVLLQIKTFGGRVDAAVRIRDALLGAAAPTVAYVDRRAISAGALITLACDTVFMSPGASIGAAIPVQGGGPGGEMKPTSEKVVSYMRAEMRATAEAKGRRGDLAEAMVDADVSIQDVTEKGKLLTLTSDKALQLHIADMIVADVDVAVRQLNLQAAERVHARAHWGEKVARLLTDPVVSSMLMTFGFLGLLMELYTPGFGIGGAIGITCLLLFFFGQYTAHLAGWEELLIFVAGMALLLVELLLIPGFGVTGMAGLALMVVGLVMALVEMRLPWSIAFELGYIQHALGQASLRIVIAVTMVIIAGFAFGGRFSNSVLGRWLVLKSTIGTSQGFVSEPPSWQALVGKQGKALSTLRPAGIADIEGKRVDVVTEGDFIDCATEIVVSRVDGNRVVVKRLGQHG